MKFPAYFSEDGIPKTGLIPLVTIYDLTNSTTPVLAQIMTEIGNGWYEYEYSGNKTHHYVFTCDSVSLTGRERYAAGEIEPDLDDVFFCPKEADVLNGLQYGPNRSMIGKLAKGSIIKDKHLDDDEVFAAIGAIIQEWGHV